MGVIVYQQKVALVSPRGTSFAATHELSDILSN